MRLAEVGNGTDNGEIEALMGAGEVAWLGATDGATDGTWLWDAGTNNSGGGTGGYFDFAAAPAANTTTEGIVLTEGATFTWTVLDVAATSPDGYVCELP